CIVQKDLVENIDKLSEYIGRGKSKYAKKMMRIGESKVFKLTKEQLINKINTLPRWQGKFNVNQDTKQIVLNTYGEVENLIDLFDERYTRSDVTDTEYDTDVKTVAQPAK
ncbi:MAG: Kiwa anti-phage protein KwaB-like domain-containing protein, partial [Floccifex sp.]